MLTVRTSENTVITSFRLITERQDFSSVRTGENTVRARARIHPANPKVFTGKAEVIPMSQQVPGMPVHNGIVIFEPGARTFWHIHPAGQFFTVLRGEGRTGVYGEKARIVKPGDVVICPAGVKHFHGAAPDSQMVQMTVTGDHREGKGVTWLEEVTDEQYNNLEK